MEADIDFLELVKALVANLFVLMGFAALCTLAGSRSVRIGKKKGACLTGLMFGAMGVVVMLTPVVMHPGYRFDSRVGVIGTAALVGGPVTGAVSLVFPILYRLHIGGSGVLAGILSIVLAYVFGLIGFFRSLPSHRVDRQPTGPMVGTHYAGGGVKVNPKIFQKRVGFGGVCL